jgi:hypothetical protein
VIREVGVVAAVATRDLTTRADAGEISKSIEAHVTAYEKLAD